MDEEIIYDDIAHALNCEPTTSYNANLYAKYIVSLETCDYELILKLDDNTRCKNNP